MSTIAVIIQADETLIYELIEMEQTLNLLLFECSFALVKTAFKWSLFEVTVHKSTDKHMKILNIILGSNSYIKTLYNHFPYIHSKLQTAASYDLILSNVMLLIYHQWLYM